MTRHKRFTRTFTLAVAGLLAVAAPIITLAQTPPDEQNPWLCYDRIGWERPCTATDIFERCVASAAESAVQCLQVAEGAVDRAMCRTTYVADYMECYLDLIKDFIL